MNKPIIREPSQRLPIDDVWNIVEEVGNPVREGEYLVTWVKINARLFKQFKHYEGMNTYTIMANYRIFNNTWEQKLGPGIGESIEITDNVYAWMEIPKYWVEEKNE